MAKNLKNQEIVNRLIEEAFNNRNTSILPELLHEDFVNHHDLLPLNNKKGPAVFEELYLKMFESFPDIKIYNHKTELENRAKRNTSLNLIPYIFA